MLTSLQKISDKIRCNLIND